MTTDTTTDQGDERRAVLSSALWCDLKADAERADWLLLGRGYETGVVAKAIQNDLAMAYSRLAHLSSAHIRDVLAERAAQDAQWGGPEHDDEHSAQDWLACIDYQSDMAESLDRANPRSRFVKIAALAVAAIESIDRKEIDK